jgi:hypothetical protein
MAAMQYLAFHYGRVSEAALPKQPLEIPGKVKLPPKQVE